MPPPDLAALLPALLGEDVPLPPEDDMDKRIVDATLKLVAESGERRLTIDDVAARARVARATIFRRFGSKDALISRLYVRELTIAGTVLRDAVEDVDDPVSALVEGYSAMLAHVCAHPVIRRLASAEPDIMAGLWRDSEPSGHSVMRAVLEGLATARSDAEDLDPEAVRQLCDVLARLMLGYLLVPDAVARSLEDPDQRDAHVRRLVTGMLRQPEPTEHLVPSEAGAGRGA